MHLTVFGSGDGTGIPVHGCFCTLCRQARAIRHLRRLPSCLQVQNQGQRLLIDAGIADLDRRLSQDPVDAVLLSGWSPVRWHGLIPIHLGSGPETTVFGPRQPAAELWLSQQPGRLIPRAELLPGKETLIGRFRILPFALNPNQNTNSQTELAYGIRDGEERLAWLPAQTCLNREAITTINDWQPDVVVAACPIGGSPRHRLEQVKYLHEQLGRPALLLTGLDHHMDRWLQSHTPQLPDGIRLAQDQQRLETGYLAEYRRLAARDPVPASVS
jgi:hypothetical protein